MRRVPRWLKTAFTAWLAVWAVAYALHYGWQNFLWICDLGSFVILAGLWRESALLLSSQLVAVLLVDVLWCVDVAVAWGAGFHPIGGTEYMFDEAIPRGIRLLSLFHVFVPAVLVFGVARCGYDRRGWLLQTALTWMVLPVTLATTGRDLNINWVYGPFGKFQSTLPVVGWFAVCMLAYPLVLYLPTHGLVLAVARLRSRRR